MKLVNGHTVSRFHILILVKYIVILFAGEDSESKSSTLLAEGKSSSSLNISPISYGDAGVYECIADNGIQPVIKSNFTLTIRGNDNEFN